MVNKKLNNKYIIQLKKGVLEILVFKLLSNQEKYGYQLIHELRQKSNGCFTLKEGTLYPILYRLEKDGMIVGKWNKEQDREVSKKYYSVTPKGKAELTELIKLWKDFSEGVTEILDT